MVASSSSLREEEEEVQDRPAGCFYPESARQAGDTEKCLQGSRTVKFLCQVAPRREVPYARDQSQDPAARSCVDASAWRAVRASLQAGGHFRAAWRTASKEALPRC